MLTNLLRAAKVKSPDMTMPPTTIAESGKIAVILGAMIAGGVVISGLFTVAALNKFVNMKSNKIYLY